MKAGVMLKTFSGFTYHFFFFFFPQR